MTEDPTNDLEVFGTSRSEPEKKPSRKRMIIQVLVGLVVMVGIFIVLFPELGSYEQAFASLATMPVWSVIGLVIACGLNIFLYPLTVLVSVPGLKYWPGFLERQTGFLISCAIPGGGVFAVGAQYRILAFYRVTPARAAAAVSADAVWVYLFTFAMPAAAITWLVLEGRNSTGYTGLAILGLLLVIVSIIFIVVILRNESGARKVGRMAERLAGPLLRRLNKPVPDFQGAMVDFRENAHDLVTKKWKAITLTNAIAQLTPLLVLVVALAGLGAYPGELTMAEIFAAYSIALLLVAVPITPGGLGTVDLALVALLKGFGTPGDIALAADVLWRIAWFLPQITAGIISMIAFFFVQRRTARHRD